MILVWLAAVRPADVGRGRSRSRAEGSQFVDPEWVVEFEVDAIIPD